ncbi:MAG: hypothetical protein U0235_32470 [Polyangiaceae bacterium]
MLRALLPVVALSLLACSAPASSDDGADPAASESSEGALKNAAPVYFAQASLGTNAGALYQKLNVLPSVTSGGAKVTGPGLFGIVCTNVDATCTLNWVQRIDTKSTQFILSGPVAKAIFNALPAADRTYQDGDVKLRCDVNKGGMLSSDIYSCAFSGLEPKIEQVSGKVQVTDRSELTESEVRSAAEKLFPNF